MSSPLNNSNVMSTGRSSIESKALKLLGSGHGPEIVAQACGVSTSRISQLLSDPEFSAQVLELRYSSLQKHNDRDDSYDSIEDTLIKKMKDLIPFMMKPGEVLAAIRIINGAKRRGVSAPVNEGTHTTHVSITLPSIITQTFITNINNQVIKAGSQELVTIQSGAMDKMSSALQNISNTQSVESIQNSKELEGN